MYILLIIPRLLWPGVKGSLMSHFIRNQQPVLQLSSLSFSSPTATIWHQATEIDSKALVTIISRCTRGPHNNPPDFHTLYFVAPPPSFPRPHQDAINSQTPVSCQRNARPSMAAPVCAYTRASRGVFMWMGLQGWYQAPLMQSQEGQGTLDECVKQANGGVNSLESNQDVDFQKTLKREIFWP